MSELCESCGSLGVNRCHLFGWTYAWLCAWCYTLMALDELGEGLKCL